MPKGIGLASLDIGLASLDGPVAVVLASVNGVLFGPRTVDLCQPTVTEMHTCSHFASSSCRSSTTCRGHRSDC